MCPHGARALSRVGLVVKDKNEPAAALAGTLSAWFARRHIAVVRASAHEFSFSSAEFFDCDLVLVLGGDGSLVSVGRALLGSGVPLAGINFGRVGFLAELSREAWEEALARTVAEGVLCERRMSLEYVLERGGRTLVRGEVLNDVVLTRGRLARLVPLELALNGESFLSLRSDGLVVSSPTGSTGYAGSAGGPLLAPLLNAYVVAAICPFLTTFPPMVLAGETEFSLTVSPSNVDLFLTLDGQELHSLDVGDVLRVRGLPGRFSYARFGTSTYLKQLKQAGFLAKRPESGTCGPL